MSRTDAPMILTCVRHTKQTGSFRNFGITLSQTHSTREIQPSSSPPTMAAEQHSPAHGAATEPRSKGQMKYGLRSEEHTSELQSLMRISYAVFCLKKKTKTN